MSGRLVPLLPPDPDSDRRVFGPDPWSRVVVFVSEPSRRDLVEFLTTHLELRDVQVGAVEAPTAWTPGTNDLPVVIFSSVRGRAGDAVTWELVARLGESGTRPVVALPGNRPVKPGFESHIAGVIRIDRDDSPPSRVFDQLLSHVIEPMPPWMRCWVDPVEAPSPIGVSWWRDELFVTDEEYGRVVRAGAGVTKTVCHGLSEPHHVHVDRGKLLVCNRGFSEVLFGTLDGGAVVVQGALQDAAGDGLLQPNGVHQAHGLTAVADTDHHRVVITRQDLVTCGSPVWEEVRGPQPRYPCGLCVDDRYVWVTDTFGQHRVLVYSHDGAFVGFVGRRGSRTGELNYPVGLARWKDLLFVADEGNRRLQAFRLRSGPRFRATPVRELARIGYPWIGSPFGLSVNIDGHLAVADRRRRCVWKLDLARLVDYTTGGM